MESTDRGRKEMKPSEASKKLEFHSKQICHGCVHPSMVGWCENHCQLPEAFEMAISALKKQEQSCDTCKHGHFGDKQCNNCAVRFPNHYEEEKEA